jgi:hypothetical protein
MNCAGHGAVSQKDLPPTIRGRPVPIVLRHGSNGAQAILMHPALRGKVVQLASLPAKRPLPIPFTPTWRGWKWRGTWHWCARNMLCFLIVHNFQNPVPLIS